MELTLRQLRAFVLVAQTRQFTAAAQQMYVTQSALSTLVKDLETVVGLKLFDRHTRRVELTNAGAQFYKEAEKILKNLETAVCDLKDLGSLQTGRVTVVASTVISSGLLSKVFKEFKGLHPNVHLVLQDVAEEEITNMVLGGGVDLGIGTCNDVPPGLVQEALFDDRFIALFHRNHPLAKRRSLAWRDLEGHPFIALAPRSPIRRLIDTALTEADIRLHVVNEVSFATTVLSLVSAEIGISVLPMNNHPSLPAFQLEGRPVVAPVITRKIGVFTQRNRSLSPPAQAFSEFLHEYVQRKEWSMQAML